MTRSLLLLVLLLVGCANGSPPVNTPGSSAKKCADPETLPLIQRQLLGAWTTKELIRVIDGTQLRPQEIPAGHVSHFYCDNTWDSVGPNFRSAGTFKWIGAAEMEMTIIESNLAIQVGMVSKRRVFVDGHRLEFHVEQTPEQLAKIMPAPKAGVVRLNVTSVITRMQRVDR